MLKINTRWTSHLKEKKQKEEFKQNVVDAKRVLERLQNILEQDIEQSIIRCEKVDNYEMARWEMFQADQMGYRRALRDITQLISFKSHEE